MAVEFILGLKSDSGQIGQRNTTVAYLDAVSKAVERAKHIWVGLVAPKAKARRQAQSKLMATMRDTVPRRKPMCPQHLKRAKILNKPLT